MEKKDYTCNRKTQFTEMWLVQEQLYFALINLQQM